MKKENKRGVGKHGKRGETKAFILLEILMESLQNQTKVLFDILMESLQNQTKVHEFLMESLQNQMEGPLLEEAHKIAIRGFAPVSRSELKKKLKDYGITPKNADAIIRNLERDKIIKIRHAWLVLTTPTFESIISIMEILTNAPYYLKKEQSPWTEIKKAPADEKPFLNALNKAFAECFLCPYGDFPFSLYVDTDMKWLKEVNNNANKKKRPTLSPIQVNEILDIANKLRGDLTTVFKLMYVWRVSIKVKMGMNSETERKISFINLSLAELPTSYILEPDNIPKTCGERFISMTGGEQFNLFLLTIFMKFVALANNNELTFLKPDLTPNEAILIKTKIILSLEKTRLLNDLYGDHERIAVKYI